MTLRSMIMRNFRAHGQTRIDFSAKVNLIHGPNGAGKTNILEALHYLCLSKSFIASQDAYALRRGTDQFEIEGEFESDRGSPVRVRLAYAPSEGKRLFVNRSPLERLSDVVGMLPVVVYSPEDAILTAGGPEERRRLMDNIMSQARPAYLDDLLKYRRVLRQRNELLARVARGAFPVSQEPVLLSWTAELATLAARIISARIRFAWEFGGFLERAYRSLSDRVERPTLTYRTFAPLHDPDYETVLQAYRAHLEQLEGREREAGRTAIGPHRDEMVFRLNDLDVRRYASHGQHRTFGMALKLAQFYFLYDRLGEKPILLLDDVFGNLDPVRAEIIVDLLQREDLGQSLVTTTHARPFDAALSHGASANASIRVTSEAGQALVIRVAEGMTLEKQGIDQGEFERGSE